MSFKKYLYLRLKVHATKISITGELWHGIQQLLSEMMYTPRMFECLELLSHTDVRFVSINILAILRTFLRR
jgi:hypothetical protein